MSISRKQQAVLSSSVPMSSLRTRSPASHFGYSNERPHLKDDATDDVPLGFGHGAIKDDDDLPEYDFVSVSDGSPNVAAPHCYHRQQDVQAISPPIDQVRRLVCKYGSLYASAHPWGGDEVLPEWYPSHSAHRYSTMQQQHVMVTPQLSSPESHVYSRLPQQHAMAVQQPWNHHHMLHPAEAQSVQSSWRSSAQWQEDAAWHARFVVEPDMAVPEPASLGGAREPWHGSWKPH